MNRWNIVKIWFLIPFVCLILSACDKDDDETKEDKIAEIQKNKEDGERFLNSLKESEDVIADDRGLLFKVNTQGNGDKPDGNDTVNIAYTAKRIDGKVFENVEKQLCMDELKEGLYIGIRYMSEGANHTLYLPYYLMYGATEEVFYGESDTVTVPAYSALIYEMELKQIIKVE